MASGFTVPWAIAGVSEEEYPVTERPGSLSHCRDVEATALEGPPETITVEVGGLAHGDLTDVRLPPRFDANRLVYTAYVNGAGRMVVARFTVADRSVRDLEGVFESNAFSVGSRIAWDDHTHFFVTRGLGRFPRSATGVGISCRSRQESGLTAFTMFSAGSLLWTMSKSSFSQTRCIARFCSRMSAVMRSRPSSSPTCTRRRSSSVPMPSS